jgi:hypothetical protein
MNIEEIIEDAFEVEDDDVVELQSLETGSVSVESKKKKERSVGGPQLFGNFLILYLMLIQKTRRYGQNARSVAINIRLKVHLELKI